MEGVGGCGVGGAGDVAPAARVLPLPPDAAQEEVAAAQHRPDGGCSRALLRALAALASPGPEGEGGGEAPRAALELQERAVGPPPRNASPQRPLVVAAV